jgi:hypothetical protein
MLKKLFYVGPSWDALHEEYAKKSRVDLNAPVQANGEIVIAAPPLEVWSTLSDVTNWPAIRSDVHDVKGNGPAAPGAVFTWASNKHRLTSRFGVVEPGRELTWTTTAPGVKMAHWYGFEPVNASSTRIRCSESLAGPIVTFVIDDKRLEYQIRTWLEGIKALAER